MEFANYLRNMQVFSQIPLTNASIYVILNEMIEAHLEKSIPCVRISADVAREKGSGAEERPWRAPDSGSADKIRPVVAEMRRAILLPELCAAFVA